MTPNLTRLFEQANNPDIDAPVHLGHIPLDVRAQCALDDIFATHGRDIIETLDYIRTIAEHKHMRPLDPFKWLTQIKEEARIILHRIERAASSIDT